MIDTNEEFGGVFYFTNPTDTEFVALWNNKEYTFPPQSTVPLIIVSEPLENIQEIRKRFAYRLAEKDFYQSETYNKMKVQGNGMPPTFDPKILEPMIEQCLKPLPIARATVKEGKKVDDERNYRASKAVGVNDNLNQVFAEDNRNIPTLGKMSDK